MSLLGLSLAIGILIDDAIVVRENIVRHIEMGEDHITASHTGTDEIGLAVTATTMSIIAVFAPIAFMGGISGQWFKPFALTVACAVLVSLFVSFSLDPMLSAYWPDPAIEAHEHRGWISRQLERFNKWFDRQADRYKDVIAWALDHRLAMVSIAIGAFIAALVIPAKGSLAALVVLGAILTVVYLLGRPIHALVKTGGIVVTIVVMVMLMKMVPAVGKLGASFIPDSDNSEINISIETPPGSNIAYTRIKAEEIGRLVRAHKEVAYVYTTVGSSTGSGEVDIGNIYVRLLPKSDRSITQGQFSTAIRGELAHIGGGDGLYVLWRIRGQPEADPRVQIHGNDQDALNQVADQMEDVGPAREGAAWTLDCRRKDCVQSCRLS